MKVITSKKHHVFYSLPKTVKGKYSAEVTHGKIYACAKRYLENSWREITSDG
jgi:hypothetical protein